jgi:hypothetical protein
VKHYEKFNYKHFSLHNLITYIVSDVGCRAQFTGLSLFAHCGKYKCIIMFHRGGGGE